MVMFYGYPFSVFIILFNIFISLCQKLKITINIPLIDWLILYLLGGTVRFLNLVQLSQFILTSGSELLQF